MNIFSKKILYIALLLVVIALAYYFYFEQSAKDLSLQLKRWNVSLNIAGFKTTDYVIEKNNFFQKMEYEAVKDDLKVNVVRVTIADHNKYIEDQKFLLRSLFLPVNSPYPEAISQVIECPDELKPKENKVPSGVVYDLFAGERFNFGVCLKDQVVYNASYGLFDCNQKGIFEVTTYGKDNKQREIIHSFSCQ